MYLPNIFTLHQWLDVYLPGQSFKAQEGVDGLEVEEQQDSCGIACPSKVLKIGCLLLPTWSPLKPLEMRAYLFASCMKLGKDDEVS